MVTWKEPANEIVLGVGAMTALGMFLRRPGRWLYHKNILDPLVGALQQTVEPMLAPLGASIEDVKARALGQHEEQNRIMAEGFSKVSGRLENLAAAVDLHSEQIASIIRNLPDRLEVKKETDEPIE